MCFVSIQGGTSKRTHIKRYKEEKAGRSVFGKTSFSVLFALGLGLITPYALGVLILKFLPNIPYCVYSFVAKI